MAALGALSPRMRARVQETVLKAKLPFFGASQVPGAAGNTLRIFLLICTHTQKKERNKPTQIDCCSALG